MNILEITEKVERHQVTRENGAGEEIEVIFNRKSGEERVYPRAFVSYLEAQKEDKQGFSNERVFYSVELEREPINGDLIVYNGETFKVEHAKRPNLYSKLYDIFVSSNKVPKRVKYGY